MCAECVTSVGVGWPLPLGEPQWQLFLWPGVCTCEAAAAALTLQCQVKAACINVNLCYFWGNSHSNKLSIMLEVLIIIPVSSPNFSNSCVALFCWHLMFRVLLKLLPRVTKSLSAKPSATPPASQQGLQRWGFYALWGMCVCVGIHYPASLASHITVGCSLKGRKSWGMSVEPSSHCTQLVSARHALVQWVFTH